MLDILAKAVARSGLEKDLNLFCPRAVRNACSDVHQPTSAARRSRVKDSGLAAILFSTIVDPRQWPKLLVNVFSPINLRCYVLSK